jgi:benzoate membrane transport protein
VFRALETPAQTLPPPREIFHSINRHHIANGLTAFLFAATGPLAILVTVASGGKLSEADIGSWLFAAYGLAGVLSMSASLAFRQPLGLAWTIPGTLLLTAAFDHLSFQEILGAYWATGGVLTVLGCTGWVGHIMRQIPLPIVMGMVAAVFLPFGLNIIAAFGTSPWVAGITVVSFIGVSLSPALTRHVPPVLAALIPGAVAVVGLGEIHLQEGMTLALAAPILYVPHFSWRAMLELVLPLVITVIATQNAQGSAVLMAAGYTPPINTLTLLCGLGSCLFALFGSVPTCVTGPANAILVSTGPRGTHYIGGLVFGLCMLAFGVFSPTMTRLALALPLSFIGLIGGLAMLHVLRSAFNVAFSTHFQLGALVAFLVTLADVQIFHIGAAFWGLTGGFLTSWLLEREAFRTLWGTDQ